MSTITKRKDYLSWDEYFMFMAAMACQRSKDPNTQVGACIVDDENKIVGIGYNGLPKGCSDDDFPWARSAEDEFDTKYPYVVHAELNSIHNAIKQDLSTARIYVTLFPCNNCAKSIIQTGIKKVYYNHIKNEDSSLVRASKRLFEAAEVELILYQPGKKLVLELF